MLAAGWQRAQAPSKGMGKLEGLDSPLQHEATNHQRALTGPRLTWQQQRLRLHGGAGGCCCRSSSREWMKLQQLGHTMSMRGEGLAQGGTEAHGGADYIGYGQGHIVTGMASATAHH